LNQAAKLSSSEALNEHEPPKLDKQNLLKEIKDLQKETEEENSWREKSRDISLHDKISDSKLQDNSPVSNTMSKHKRDVLDEVSRDDTHKSQKILEGSASSNNSISARSLNSSLAEETEFILKIKNETEQQRRQEANLFSELDGMWDSFLNQRLTTIKKQLKEEKVKCDALASRSEELISNNEELKHQNDELRKENKKLEENKREMQSMETKRLQLEHRLQSDIKMLNRRLQDLQGAKEEQEEYWKNKVRELSDEIEEKSTENSTLTDELRQFKDESEYSSHRDNFFLKEKESQENFFQSQLNDSDKKYKDLLQEREKEFELQTEMAIALEEKETIIYKLKEQISKLRNLERDQSANESSQELREKEKLFQKAQDECQRLKVQSNTS
jgi:hypothetical protein